MPEESQHRFEPVETALDLFHTELLGLDGGEVADYIPELAQADPERFGLALVSMDSAREWPETAGRST